MSGIVVELDAVEISNQKRYLKRIANLGNGCRVKRCLSHKHQVLICTVDDDINDLFLIRLFILTRECMTHKVILLPFVLVYWNFIKKTLPPL